MKQFITIIDDGISYRIPDKFISDRIHGEYKNLSPLQAWSKAIGDWISSERAKAEAEHKGEGA